MGEMKKTTALILAGGKGTRMKSGLAKVLHEVFGRPMIHHVVLAVRQTSINDVVVVTGHQNSEVEKALSSFEVSCALQKEQLGTGHAVQIAESRLPTDADSVLILCGDTPLIRPATFSAMLARHQQTGAALTVMTTILADPQNYGRIVSGDNGGIDRIVEEKDASAEQRKIREINAGIYCVDRGFLYQALSQVDTDNQQGEIYLTDIVGIARRQGLTVERYVCEDSREVLGVNSRVELAQAEAGLRTLRNRKLMEEGVTLIDPDATYVSEDTSIGRDSVLEPNVHIRGKSVLGEGVRIGSFSIITDCRIADGGTVAPGSHLSNEEVS